MGEVLPISSPLDKIAGHFLERKWMRAGKAWRCYIQLPNHPTLPSMLTALIDQKVSATIRGPVDVTISPAFVVDVPSKGKRFCLVIETCFENQATLGPYLTALTDTPVSITIEKFREAAPVKPVNPFPLSSEELRGLHLGFFQNQRFWEYLEGQTQRSPGSICSKEEAKAAFKEHLKVESCKDIPRDAFTDFLAGFNAWIRSARG